MKFNKWTLGLAALAASALFISTPVRAQVTNVPNQIPEATISHALTEFGSAIGSATNWDIVAGYGHSVNGGDNNIAFAALAYNVSEHVGFVLGYDYLWNAKNDEFNSLKGGVNLQTTVHPFAFLGSTSLTNWVATPFVADLLATPRHGDAIGNIITTGVNVEVYTFKNFRVDAGVQYERRMGQGEFNGDYILGHIGIGRTF